MTELLNYFGVSGLALIIISVLFEITPIPINPIAWLGNHFNKGMKDDVKKINAKLDEHIAQSYRSKIMSFQDDLLRNDGKTQEQFDEVIDACEKYEQYVKDNDVPNEKCKLAMKFIKSEYLRNQTNRTFIDLPIVEVEE